MSTTTEYPDRPASGLESQSRPGPLALVAEVAEDLARQAARSLDVLDGTATSAHDSEALGGVAGLLGAIDRLLAAVVVVLMRCDRPSVVIAEGLTIESWLRAVARRTGADAGMLIVAAERLADMPATLRAFRDGVLSWGTVRGIVISVRVLTAEQRRWLDGTLAGDRARLRCLDGDAVVAAADRLVEQARPDLRDQRAQRASAGQRLVLQPGMDGSGEAFAAMDSETFTAVQTAIETLTHDAAGRRVASNIEALRALARQRLARRDRDATAAHGDRDATAAHGDRGDAPDGPGNVTDDKVTAPDVGGAPSAARPEMIVITDVSLLADPVHDVGRRRVDQATASGTFRPRDIAQLLWRQDRPSPSLTPEAVQRLACDATLRPVLTDGAKVLGTAEPYARISAPLRAALIARDGHCRFASCHRPVDVCEAHHVIPRLRGGPTVLDNLALMCAAHHHAVHEGRWHATLHKDGSMTFVRRGVTLRSLPRAGQVARSDHAPPAGRNRRRPATRHGPAAGSTDLPF